MVAPLPSTVVVGTALLPQYLHLELGYDRADHWYKRPNIHPNKETSSIYTYASF